jgi:benzoate/toluate 1,2-dioxygenase beta subunit
MMHEAEDFVLHEAELLDEMRWDDWLALFLPDATYWVPSRPDQPDPIEEVSLIYDDLPFLQARVAQLKHPLHYANLPLVRGSRHVSNIRVTDLPDGASVRSKLLMLQCRGLAQQLFSATVTHTLRKTGAGWRIAAKTVVLVNGDAPHEEIVVPF